MIIDGGKGQLNVVFEILKNYKIEEKIDLIALAKQQEEVYTLNSSSPIKLGNSQEDNLIKFIRDEAHRFAIKYNRLLLRKGLKG